MVVALIIACRYPLWLFRSCGSTLSVETAVVIPLGSNQGEKNVMQKKLSHHRTTAYRYMISRIFIIAAAMTAVSLALYVHYSTLYGLSYGKRLSLRLLSSWSGQTPLTRGVRLKSVFKRLKVWNRSFFIGLSVSIAYRSWLCSDRYRVPSTSTNCLGDLFITSIIAFVSVILVGELHKFIGRGSLKD